MAEPFEPMNAKPAEGQLAQRMPPSDGQSPMDPKTGSSSKKGIAIIAIVLVALILIAAIVYNTLTSSMTPDQVASTTRSSQGGAALPEEGSASSPEDEIDPAPDFSMTTVDGEELTLSSLHGRPVVLNFWASTCGPCRQEMPEFQNAFEEYADQVCFVMLNVPDFNGETRDRALSLIAQNGYTFPVYFQVDKEASVKYGINSIPRTYFINSEGDIVAYAAGSIDGSSLEQGIEMILE